VLLRELQHRVKNNLQMITALIRLEARNLPDDATGSRFDRLAGRIEALALLYRSLSDDANAETIDLGVYLSEIASAVMRAHAPEGIRLDLKVDTWPVSVNVAMPTGAGRQRASDQRPEARLRRPRRRHHHPAQPGRGRRLQARRRRRRRRPRRRRLMAETGQAWGDDRPVAAPERQGQPRRSLGAG
jgi:hypothetical protein